MAENLVLRSIYLPEVDDAQLRQLAHEHKVTKSDLIRAAVRLKLKEWREDNTKEKLPRDVAVGLREPDSQSEVKSVRPPSIKERTQQPPAAPVAGQTKTKRKVKASD